MKIILKLKINFVYGRDEHLHNSLDLILFLIRILFKYILLASQIAHTINRAVSLSELYGLIFFRKLLKSTLIACGNAKILDYVNWN